MSIINFNIDEIIHDFLRDLREGRFANAIPTKVRVAINLMCGEFSRLRHVEEENMLLRERILEEQTQRAILETIIASTPRRQTSPTNNELDNFGSRIAIH